jgi:hypothetical protein
MLNPHRDETTRWARSCHFWNIGFSANMKRHAARQLQLHRHTRFARGVESLAEEAVGLEGIGSIF